MRHIKFYENFTSHTHNKLLLLQEEIREEVTEVIDLIWDVIEKYEDDNTIENAEVSICCPNNDAFPGLTIAICPSDLDFKFYDKGLMEFGNSGKLDYWVCVSGKMNYLSELHTELTTRIESIYELEDCEIQIHYQNLKVQNSSNLGDWIEIKPPISKVDEENISRDMILTLKIRK